jgi:hypothetical protein
VKKNCKTKLHRTAVEEKISRMENTSPGRDAVVSSLPTWSAAYLKQTCNSNRFLIYLTMLCPPPAYPEIQRNFTRCQDSRGTNLSRNPYRRVKLRQEYKYKRKSNTTFHRNTSINHVLFYGGKNKHCFIRTLQSSTQKNIRTSAEEV